MLLSLFAQVTPVVVPGKEWLLLAVVALTPVVVTIIDWLATTYAGNIPPWIKPILATALGSALTYLGGLTTGDPLMIAVIGLAVAGIRQVVVHLGRAAGVFAK